MTAVAGMRRWLGTLDAERLADVLVRRPDAAGPKPPRDLGELANRLSTERSVAEAFTSMVRPAVQVAEALQALWRGPEQGVQRAALAALLGVDQDDPGLDATLTVLADWALVWPEDETLHLAAPLAYAFATPLRLGEPARMLLAEHTTADLRAIAGALGLPAPMGKERLLDTVAGALGSADFVRTTAATAPPAAREMLAEVAHHGPLISGVFAGFRPVDEAPSWALDRGLLVQAGWETAEMPREVALALRGPRWRAPFDPVPPSPKLAPLPPNGVADGAAAAAGSALDQVTALMEACAGGPVTLLKAGGVGARELRRLAKAAGGDEDLSRLWLEVAAAAGLLAVTSDGVLPTDVYDEWLALPPAERLAALVNAWTTVRSIPLDPRRPLLLPDQFGSLFATLRGALLRVLRSLPPGLGATGDLEPLVTWHAPLLTTAFGDDATDLIGALVDEAVAIGVVAHGALSPLGAALADALAAQPSAPAPAPASASTTAPAVGPASTAAGTPAPALVAAAARLVAPALRSARFQADLSVIVAGTPGHELVELLDSCADREARGTASIWRLSAASVRRALDSGLSPADLLTRLRGVAAGGVLPQPVEYLFKDAERRHGTVRVRPAGCVIHSDDTALLAEIAAARGLRTLALSSVAPTVLVSSRPPAETLAALRGAGYAPVSEDATGTVQVERTARRRVSASAATSSRSGAARGRGGRTDFAALARKLVASSSPPVPLPSQPTAAPEPDDSPSPEPAVDVSAAQPVPGQRPRLRLLTGGGGDDAPDEDLLTAAPGSAPGVAPGSAPGVARPELVRGGRDRPSTSSSTPPTGTIADLLTQRAPQLPAEDVALLGSAIERRVPVQIVYTDTRGITSTRLIDTIELHGQVIEAWCHLRNDDRAFSLSRIQSVSPA